MKPLSSKEYWDNLYANPAGLNRSSDRRIWRFLVNIMKKFFGSRVGNYSEYLLWDVIYDKYLPRQPGLKILEIGSAPGYNLVRFKRTFGYNPYGLEYSEPGVAKNRQKFSAAGINPKQVIFADFFSPAWQEQYQNFFDIVMSGGFIEHFDDPAAVVSQQLALLKPGGILIVAIPNLRGLNYWLMRFFNKELLAAHNFSLMALPSFKNCFSALGLQTLVCRYYGTLYLGLFSPERKFVKYWPYRFLVRLQAVFNVFFRTLFGAKSFENKYTSPYLIYLGRKF
jgi:SAM-dependent methyltransferase